jgi:hypothetical protein
MEPTLKVRYSPVEAKIPSPGTNTEKVLGVPRLAISIVYKTAPVELPSLISNVAAVLALGLTIKPLRRVRPT